MGENTYGKFYGSFTIPDTEDPVRHNWAMQPIVFKYTSSIGYSGFTNGIVPDIAIEDEILGAKSQSFWEVSHLIGFVILTGLVIFSFFLFRHFKEIFFGIWWFLITLFPVYNLVQIFNPIAERYLYLPVIGFCLLVPILLFGIFSRASPIA